MGVGDPKNGGGDGCQGGSNPIAQNCGKIAGNCEMAGNCEKLRTAIPPPPAQGLVHYCGVDFCGEASRCTIRTAPAQHPHYSGSRGGGGG